MVYVCISGTVAWYHIEARQNGQAEQTLRDESPTRLCSRRAERCHSGACGAQRTQLTTPVDEGHANGTGGRRRQRVRSRCCGGRHDEQEDADGFLEIGCEGYEDARCEDC